MEDKPTLFVASSVESLEIARAVHDELQYDADVVLWPHGSWTLSRSTLEDLLGIVCEMDFGAFIFGADDVVRLRKAPFKTVRDNVLFELGIFMGNLGRERNFIVQPTAIKNFHLPTDLIGVKPASYDSTRVDRDGNIQAAVAPACNAIRREIKRLGRLRRIDEPNAQSVQPKPNLPKVEPVQPNQIIYGDDDATNLLYDWLSQFASGEKQTFKFEDADKGAGVQPGCARRLLEVAARRLYWKVHIKGDYTITFEFDDEAYTASLNRNVHPLMRPDHLW